MEHSFKGKWITDEEFYALEKRNIFHRQLDKKELPCTQHRNRHILFRKKISLEETVKNANIYISADDYYKLYINGQFVGQGPAPSYHFQYNYNVIDVASYLKKGENVIAVHTLYQGLINRVWQSGDYRHGLILDLIVNDQTVLASDDSFKTKPHSGYREMGTVGYDTQFMEEYDARCPEIGFEQIDYDDSSWETAKINKYEDHQLKQQTTSMLTFEKIYPASQKKMHKRNANIEMPPHAYSLIQIDFGATYVGYLSLTAKGNDGDEIWIRCGQELNPDGSVRFCMRCNCRYEEKMILSDGESQLDWFDYKSFRYVELLVPENCQIEDICLIARYYPFTCNAKLKPEYENDLDLKNIWDLCIHTIKYGVQEVIQDCMDREKGFYVGDGCYTSLVHMILTKDDSIARKLIDDAFSSAFITDGLVTCLDCSMMQEIAEYPLMLVYLVLWHYQLTKDAHYLSQNYPKVQKLLEAYRRDYETDGLLRNLDKWCVVEWPKNFQHEYDVDITEGKICVDAHVVLNAYYLEAIKKANQMAKILGEEKYRDEAEIKAAFLRTFYDEKQHLFKDGEHTEHISLVGNIFPFAYELYPDKECCENILNMLLEKKISSLSLFCVFPALEGLIRCGRSDLIKTFLKDEGAWKRMLAEGATTTFESWGKDMKWNTSLFHLTFSYALLFMADIDLENLFN